LGNLFGQLPDALPQSPRRKGVKLTQEKKNNSSPPPAPPATSWLDRLLHFIRRWLLFSTQAAAAPPRQNPFASLKMGKKIIVIAAVDSGNISFFRFGQGGFEEWPML